LIARETWCDTPLNEEKPNQEVITMNNNDLYHQANHSLNRICTALLVMIILQLSATAQAEEIKMYREVPSASEMASLLFPKTSARPKTRSISFDSVATVSPPPETASIGIGLPIQFEFNSDEITSYSRPYIDELGKMLSREDLRSEKVVIEGHTDASGSAQYNQELSMKRAHAVKQYLFYKYDIDRDRLVVSGKGEYAPLGGQDPFAAVNRRVEIHKYQ
jgi:outer membrane protein OmpA-like peptidoglycan-associated protein